MKYREMTLYLDRDVVDVVCAMLYDYPIQGVEIIDQYLSEEDQKAMFVDVMGIESKIEKEIPIKFYLSYEEDYIEILKSINVDLLELNKRMPLGSMRLEFEDSNDDDWAHTWKQYYKPFMIGNRILVKPIWEDISINEAFNQAPIIIDIDPGMAFGSGTHETTSMCVKALDAYIEPEDTFIDLGCGSGILGIAAAKLGAKKGILIDLDQSACKIARENVISNKVGHQLEVLHGDLLENVTTVVDLVVANIFADIIIGVTPDVTKILKVGGLFITSGIITEKEDNVKHALIAGGFSIVDTYHEGGWVAIISRKEA